MATSFTKTLPAGSYYVGDLCYIIPKAVWSELCDQWFDPSKDGVTATYIDPITNKEVTCYAFQTAYGDGMYESNHGFIYSVDAGIIGIVAAPITTDDPSIELYTAETFYKDFEISTDGHGFMEFGHININTAWEEDEDDEGYYDYDEEEYEDE